MGSAEGRRSGRWSQIDKDEEEPVSATSYPACICGNLRLTCLLPRTQHAHSAGVEGMSRASAGSMATRGTGAGVSFDLVYEYRMHMNDTIVSRWARLLA